MTTARACITLADQRQRVSIALRSATAPQLALIEAALRCPSEIALMHATEIVGGTTTTYRRREALERSNHNQTGEEGSPMIAAKLDTAAELLDMTPDEFLKGVRDSDLPMPRMLAGRARWIVSELQLHASTSDKATAEAVEAHADGMAVARLAQRR